MRVESDGTSFVDAQLAMGNDVATRANAVRNDRRHAGGECRRLRVEIVKRDRLADDEVLSLTYPHVRLARLGSAYEEVSRSRPRSRRRQ